MNKITPPQFSDCKGNTIRYLSCAKSTHIKQRHFIRRATKSCKEIKRSLTKLSVEEWKVVQCKQDTTSAVLHSTRITQTALHMHALTWIDRWVRTGSAPDISLQADVSPPCRRPTGACICPAPLSRPCRRQRRRSPPVPRHPCPYPSAVSMRVKDENKSSEINIHYQMIAFTNTTQI